MRLLFIFAILAGASCRADENARCVLDEINLARTHPREYARILVAQQDCFQSRDGQRALREAVNFLNRARPLPPLAFSNGLSMSAMTHVTSQGANGTTGHRGIDRSTPWNRIGRYGKWYGRAGENIAYGIQYPRRIVATLIVDAGVGNRGHRKNIFCAGFGVAGVACGRHARYGTMCVMDFAGGFVEKPQFSGTLPLPQDDRG